jgi:hypothetical protein
MRKWKVTIQRVEYRSADFEVSAETRDEAEQAAIEESFDFDFDLACSETADESVVSVQEIPGD